MKALWLIGMLALSFSAYAGNSPSRGEMWAATLGCGDSSHGNQRVYAYSGATQLDDWNVDPTSVHRERLPNGYIVGLKIEPVAASFYKNRIPFQDMKYAPELVKISLYDISHKTPRLLTYTFGGTNSIQGYSERGGADRVSQLGQPGLTLILQKPVCVPVVALNDR